MSPARGHFLEILKKVSSRGTRWSLVYDLERRTVYVRTSANPELRCLAQVDFLKTLPPEARKLYATFGNAEPECLKK